MKFQDFLAMIGGFVLLMAFFGAIEVADFRMYFGPDADAAGCSLTRTNQHD